MTDDRTVLPPCVLHEDEHLLVVNKPAGWNTHAPAPYAGEGIYEWLRHREPRWAALGIIQRLDRDTSGVLVFAKTPLASHSLTTQFRNRTVRKRYLLLTDGRVPAGAVRVTEAIARQGERHEVRAPDAGGLEAITLFTPLGNAGTSHLLAAEPLTGRTHQIRVHAAAQGFAIRGDTLYGGSPAPRLCLHAETIELRHPQSDEMVRFSAAADFATLPATALRAACIDPADTDACRLLHGAADAHPGCYVDRLGSYVLVQAESIPEGTFLHTPPLDQASAVYFRRLARDLQRLDASDACPQCLRGDPAPERFEVRENGIRFALGFTEGYSVGLFLDQRDNRRRLLTGHVAADFPLYANGLPQRRVLNAFAYTCGFSVCAALGGAQVTSLDLSRRYLDWGRQNFTLNGLDPQRHDFIYGDAFDWLRRLQNKGRRFEVILLDPPTFSRSRQGTIFRAEQDYGRLLAAALPLLATGGVLFASTNAARLRPETFVDIARTTVHAAGRRILQEHYVPQPPDFPITRDEPAHLKTLWLRVG